MFVLVCSTEPPSFDPTLWVLRYIFDFEEFRLIAANACVAIVTVTKSVATVTTTTNTIIFFRCRCIEGLSLLYFKFLLGRRYYTIYKLSNSFLYFILSLIYWNDYRKFYVYFKVVQVLLNNSLFLNLFCCCWFLVYLYCFTGLSAVILCSRLCYC